VKAWRTSLKTFLSSRAAILKWGLEVKYGATGIFKVIKR